MTLCPAYTLHDTAVFRDFSRFTKRLLSDQSLDVAGPSFSAATAFSHFSESYGSSHPSFSKPDWLPSPVPPLVPFESDDFCLEELRHVVNRSKAKSTPSPLDQVYTPNK